MHQPRSFLQRRAKVGYWGKRLRKAIRKYRKQLDRNRIQSDEKKVEYSKAWVN